MFVFLLKFTFYLLCLYLISFYFQIIFIFATVFTLVYSRPQNENTVRVSQDTNGNYDIEYNLENSFRKEVRQNGMVTGSYSYIDSNGVVQTVQYIAGPKTGFVIVDSTNSPSSNSFLVPVVPVYRYTPDAETALLQQNFKLVEKAIKNTAAAN